MTTAQKNTRRIRDALLSLVSLGLAGSLVNCGGIVQELPVDEELPFDDRDLIQAEIGIVPACPSTQPTGAALGADDVGKAAGVWYQCSGDPVAVSVTGIEVTWEGYVSFLRTSGDRLLSDPVPGLDAILENGSLQVITRPNAYANPRSWEEVRESRGRVSLSGDANFLAVSTDRGTASFVRVSCLWQAGTEFRSFNSPMEVEASIKGTWALCADTQRGSGTDSDALGSLGLSAREVTFDDQKVVERDDYRARRDFGIPGLGIVYLEQDGSHLHLKGEQMRPMSFVRIR